MNDDLRYYGNPMNWESTKGDIISREALLNEFDTKCQSICPTCEYHKWNSKLKRYECELINTAPTVEPHIKYTVEKTIDNAQVVSDRYYEGYAQGYIDGSTGADWRGEEE